ncbi:dihydrouridine synthase (dus) protein [Cardiosporidium cionae]|uniref:Dihydrouridine synthase (Dus) protein n=1 Tax=Cardiosporidium cionae TaxID=476202 RepID=A0ABQ7JE87_9APIC|nr:dihydrouridine synthase (dus) protein [Cardiosporidium cionae]|eukprot:KAF8822323.1 dihydrouridine synthase (dus) protein [Cardiosporidium cionae]
MLSTSSFLTKNSPSLARNFPFSFPSMAMPPYLSSSSSSSSIASTSTISTISYHSKYLLAPMVRIGILPFRLECLKYGADLVFSEEIIDKKLLNTVRVYNPIFDIIEYIHLKDNRVVFSTNKEEKGKVILQLGTADPSLALAAAKLVAQDVAAIDVNMGCPKSFSVKGGMGAALLKTPSRAYDILSMLTQHLEIPVSCKIRLLSTLEETIEFAKGCERCGISALTVHMRTENERPSQKAHWNYFTALKEALSIPVIANGDLFTQTDINAFQDNVGADSLMFARGAMWNPSIFLKDGVERPSKRKIIQDFIKRAIRCRAVFPAIKYIVLEMLSRETDRAVHESLLHLHSILALCQLFDLGEWYTAQNISINMHSVDYYKDVQLKMQKNVLTSTAPA